LRLVINPTAFFQRAIQILFCFSLLIKMKFTDTGLRWTTRGNDMLVLNQENSWTGLIQQKKLFFYDNNNIKRVKQFINPWNSIYSGENTKFSNEYRPRTFNEYEFLHRNVKTLWNPEKVPLIVEGVFEGVLDLKEAWKDWKVTDSNLIKLLKKPKERQHVITAEDKPF